MAKKTKGAAKAAPTIRVAVLDGAGVLQSFDEVPADSAAKITNGMPEWVEVPADCDLKAGRYCWDQQGGKFDPIKSAKVDAETALIDLIKAVRDQAGVALPATTESWVAEYDKRKARAGA